MKQALGLGCVGFLVAAVFAAITSWFVAARLEPVEPDVRVVIAARDLVDGEVLTGDALAELVMPARFSHAAMIPSELAPQLVGLRIAAAQSGTAFTWSHFTDHLRAERESACTVAVGESLAPELAAATEAVLTQVRVAAPVENEVPEGDVLVLARDVKPGAVLVDADLKALRVSADLLTSSWISASRRAEVVGSGVVTGLSVGDPLWWQMLEPGGPPGTLSSCLSRITTSKAEVRERLAPGAAQVWVEREAKSW